jgi:hypothetical protein
MQSARPPLGWSMQARQSRLIDPCRTTVRRAALDQCSPAHGHQSAQIRDTVLAASLRTRGADTSAHCEARGNARPLPGHRRHHLVAPPPRAHNKGLCTQTPRKRGRQAGGTGAVRIADRSAASHEALWTDDVVTAAANFSQLYKRLIFYGARGPPTDGASASLAGRPRQGHVPGGGVSPGPRRRA